MEGLKRPAASYLEELGSFFRAVETTGLAGGAVDFNDAMFAAVKTVVGQAQEGKKVTLIGNGGSASIANHIAVDLWKNGGVRATSFSDSSLLTCIGNDFGYRHVFEKPISMFADEGDVLIAISSSGRSENILRGVQGAREKNCRIITMSGFGADNPLRRSGDLNFYVPSDSYGFVEITHLALCHCLVDMIIELKRDAG